MSSFFGGGKKKEPETQAESQEPQEQPASASKEGEAQDSQEESTFEGFFTKTWDTVRSFLAADNPTTTWSPALPSFVPHY